MVVLIWSGPLTRIGLTIRFPTFRRVSACEPDSGIGRLGKMIRTRMEQGAPSGIDAVKDFRNAE